MSEDQKIYTPVPIEEGAVTEQTQALAKVNVTEQTLQELETKYRNLIIAGPEDKAGMKTATEAAKLCKKLRTSTVKVCKEGRQPHIDEQARWIEVEKSITSRLSKIEDHLLGEKERIEKLLADAARAEAEAAARKAATRIQTMAEVGATLSYEDAVNFSDEEFDSRFAQEQATFEKAEAAKAALSLENEALKGALSQLQKEMEEMKAALGLKKTPAVPPLPVKAKPPVEDKGEDFFADICGEEESSNDPEPDMFADMKEEKKAPENEDFESFFEEATLPKPGVPKDSWESDVEMVKNFIAALEAIPAPVCSTKEGEEISKLIVNTKTYFITRLNEKIGVYAV